MRAEKWLNIFLNTQQEYGFDINKRVEGSGNTPVMEAIALGKDEDPVEADKIISSFISLVHLELMDTDQLINFNMKNNLEQSVAWSVDCLHSFKTLGTNSATF